MRQLVVCHRPVLSGVILLALGLVAAEPCASPSGHKPWRPVFSDEFDGEKPSAPLRRSTISGQAAHYQPLPPKVVPPADGVHVLTVRFDGSPFSFGGFSWTRAASTPQIDK